MLDSIKDMSSKAELAELEVIENGPQDGIDEIVYGLAAELEVMYEHIGPLSPWGRESYLNMYHEYPNIHRSVCRYFTDDFPQEEFEPANGVSGFCAESEVILQEIEDGPQKGIDDLALSLFMDAPIIDTELEHAQRTEFLLFFRKYPKIFNEIINCAPSNFNLSTRGLFPVK
jgi:hypothetical protein